MSLKKKNRSRKGAGWGERERQSLQNCLFVYQSCGYWEELETDTMKDTPDSVPGTTVPRYLPGIGSRTPQGCQNPQMLILTYDGSAFACNLLPSSVIFFVFCFFAF